jgi:hypothetical protein
MKTQDEARVILEREVAARLELKLTKAKTFLGLTSRGMGTTQAWQQVAVECADLEAAHEAAQIEVRLLDYEMRLTELGPIDEL